MKKRGDTLGRPAPDEDKDMNEEQLKARRGRAPASALPTRQPKEAERIDPTERTRAGENR